MRDIGVYLDGLRDDHETKYRTSMAQMLLDDLSLDQIFANNRKFEGAIRMLECAQDEYSFAVRRFRSEPLSFVYEFRRLLKMHHDLGQNTAAEKESLQDLLQIMDSFAERHFRD
jgi:hypothetical protein